MASSTFAALPAAVKSTLAGRRPKLQLTYEKAIHTLIDATPGLNRRTCDLLHKLALGADGDLICELAQETIARRIRCSVDTVARGQREAIDRRLLEVTNQRDRRTGHHRRSKYRLLVRFVDHGAGRLPTAYWENDKVVPLTTDQIDGDLKASWASTDPQTADPLIRTKRHSRGSSFVGKEISVTSPPAFAFSRERAVRSSGGAVSKANEVGFSGPRLVDVPENTSDRRSLPNPAKCAVDAALEPDGDVEVAVDVIHKLDRCPPQMRAFTGQQLRHLVDAGVHPARLREFADDFAGKRGPFFGLFALRTAIEKTIAALQLPGSPNAAFCARYRKAPPSNEEQSRRRAERAYVESRQAVADDQAAAVLHLKRASPSHAPIMNEKPRPSRSERETPALCRKAPPDLLAMLLARVRSDTKR